MCNDAWIKIEKNVFSFLMEFSFVSISFLHVREKQVSTPVVVLFPQTEREKFLGKKHNEQP